MAKKILLLIFVALILVSIFPLISSQQIEKNVCAIYFTGVGCPHCANVDLVVLTETLNNYSNLAIIEYEIYQDSENAPLLIDYNEKYGTGLGIPLIIFEHGYKIGDRPILENINLIIEYGPSVCFLPDGSKTFENLIINDLRGKPKIWTNERILIKDSGGTNKDIKDLLTTENLSEVLEYSNYNVIMPQKVALSGSFVEFENAITIDGWIFQWNGPSIESKCPSCPQPTEWSECINGQKTRTNYKCSLETGYECVSYTETDTCNGSQQKLTMAKLISLAAVDAINPCALAVLTLMLIAILTYNPRNKKNVLLAGLAFTCSIFIMYLIYGLIIIKFFQVIQFLTITKIWLYRILGFGAMIFGILNIKDFVKYRPGGACTEMPMKMRPKVQQIISKITSPRGAFGVGIFVTIFLLPCTIGPYVIAGGILSAFELIKTIPPLLLYNFIFVLPMLIITLVVYTGFAKIQDVSGWKDKNIKLLHLIAGIIMFGLGLAMVVGWV